MEILRGSKKEITIRLWSERAVKGIKRLADSIECFVKFSELDDIDRAIEDAEALAKTLRDTREALKAMEKMGVE